MRPILHLKALMLIALSSVTLFIPASGQTWTAIPNRTGRVCSGPPILLSDGTIAVDGYDDTSPGYKWDKLTPDNQGSYTNGTWSALAGMHDTRSDFSSQLLKDGRLYVAGGEYGTGGGTAEIYDPLANTWTYTSPSGFAGNIVDANSEILSDGTVLQAAVDDNSGRGCKIYNPVSNTWSATILALKSEWEAAYVKLPDGSILMVDFGATTSERFIPSLGSWIADANVPVTLYDAAGEMGGGYLLPNGKVFFVGATGHTAIYTPSGNNNPGSYIAGPDLPDGTGQPDAPGCMMATGNILLAASPLSAGEYNGPTYFYEYNYLKNSYTRIAAPGGGTSIPSACYQAYMTALPNGQVILGLYEINDQYYVYTPAGYGSVVSSGKPAITQVTQNSCNQYTMTGTLFGGISEGSSYGDDAQSFSNYPIVRLTSGSNVYYARTYNWSTRDVQQGTKPATVQFTLPAGLSPGSYTMSVSVNGIPSDPRTLITTSCNSSCTAPQNVVPSGVSSTSESLNWTASGASSYYIYYKKQTDANWTLAVSGLTSPTYTFTGLTPGTAYNADVYAVCADSTYPVTHTSFTTQSQSACPAPQNLVNTAISSTSEKISWSASGATYYYIYYEKQTGGTWTLVNNLTSPTYTLTGLSASTAYVVDVYAVCPDGTYPGSTITFTTQSGTSTCPAPQNVIATGISPTSERLDWSASGASYYYIYYEKQTGGTWTLVNNLTSPTYTFTGLSANTNYTADIYAVCPNGTYPVTRITFTAGVSKAPVNAGDKADISDKVPEIPESRVNAYPNPVHNNLTITGMNGKNLIVIYNTMGQRVLSKTTANAIETINMGDLVNGIYLVKIIGEDNKPAGMLKVIKN